VIGTFVYALVLLAAVTAASIVAHSSTDVLVARCSAAAPPARRTST
jgi:hypothetical protein